MFQFWEGSVCSGKSLRSSHTAGRHSFNNLISYKFCPEGHNCIEQSLISFGTLSHYVHGRLSASIVCVQGVPHQCLTHAPSLPTRVCCSQRKMAEQARTNNHLTGQWLLLLLFVCLIFLQHVSFIICLPTQSFDQSKKRHNCHYR